MFNTPEFQDFLHYVRVRQNMYLYRRKKVAEKPTEPWLAFSFTNNYRVLDRLTQYNVTAINTALHNNVNTAEEINKVASIVYIQNVFNREDVIRDIPFHIFKDIPNNIEKLRTWCDVRRLSGEPVFSNAYLMAPPPDENTSRHDVYINALVELLEKDLLVTLWNATTVEERFRIFKELHGFAGFLSYQFALTFSYVQNCTDYDDFIVAGPGAKKGLRLVFPDSTPSDYNGIMRGIVELMKETGEFDITEQGVHLRPLGNDVQNMFCEYSKYWRLSAEEPFGKKRYYKPTHGEHLPEPEMPLAWRTKGRNL